MEIYFRVHFLWLPALIWALCCIWSCAQSIHLMRSGRPHRLQRFCVFFVVENVSEMSNLGNNFQLCCMRLVLAGSHDMVAWTLLMTGQCDSWFNIETIHRVKLFYIYHLGRISLCNSFIFYRKLIKVGLNTSLLLLSYFFCSNQYFSNSTTPKWSTVRCDFVLSKKVRKLTFHFIQKLFTTRCILLALIRSAVHFTSPGQIECCQATPIFNEPTFLGILLFRDHFFLGDWPAHSIWNYQLWSLWSMILKNRLILSYWKGAY